MVDQNWFLDEWGGYAVVLMNCDVNNLARQSSCLRCLTDAQLNQVRTYLLCQWAQRETGGTPNAPTNPDITAGSIASNIVVTWTNPTPVGSTNEVWKSADGITFALFTTVGGGVNQATDATGLGVGQFAYYKIRSCDGASCSAFSNVISAVNQYTSPNVAAISFPTLVRTFGLNSFTASGLAALTSVSLPALKHADSNLNLSANPNLTSVTLTVLQDVGNSLFLGANSLTGALSLPALTRVGVGGPGDLQFQSNNITSFSAPQLTTIASNLVGRSCPLMTTVTLTVLSTIGVGMDFSTSAFTTLSLPALTSVGGDVLLNNSSFTSVSFPALTAINPNNLFVINALVCPALASLSIPQLIFPDGFEMGFTGAALNAASINQILAKGVASGVAGSDFELAGGTNAAPSGQGIADKAILIGLGNAVNTN